VRIGIGRLNLDGGQVVRKGAATVAALIKEVAGIEMGERVLRVGLNGAGVVFFGPVQ